MEIGGVRLRAEVEKRAAAEALTGPFAYRSQVAGVATVYYRYRGRICA